MILSSFEHVAVVVVASFPSVEDPADGVVVGGVAAAAVVVAGVVDEAAVDGVELAEPVEPVGLVALVGTVVDEHHFALASFLLPSVHDHSSSEGRHL